MTSAATTQPHAGDAPQVRSSGAAARASATLVHDLRGPLVTIDGFSGEIALALAELDALLAARGDGHGSDEAIVARLRELLEEDLHPCLGFVRDTARVLHARIDALALDAPTGTREA